MPDSPEPPKKENSSTYVVQDRQNEEELIRVGIQDFMLTSAMGGALPEQGNPQRFRRVLDIGCGPGGWIIEAAEHYPAMSLVGVDISRRMIDHADEQARAHQLTDRVEFRVMDALLMLEFPAESFDLINIRLGVSFMRQWDWEKLMSEMHRVLCSNGIVRIIEGEIDLKSPSVALSRFYALFQCAFFRAGHLFTQEPAGLINALPALFVRFSFQHIQSAHTTREYRTGTEAGTALYGDHMHLFHVIRPFLQKHGCVPSDYEAICKQALVDIQQPDFVATGDLHTLWATKP